MENASKMHLLNIGRRQARACFCYDLYYQQKTKGAKLRAGWRLSHEVAQAIKYRVGKTILHLHHHQRCAQGLIKLEKPS